MEFILTLNACLSCPRKYHKSTIHVREKRGRGGWTKRDIERKLFLAKREEASDLGGEDDENDVACLYCNERYLLSASNEGWMQCGDGQNGIYEQCRKADENDEMFISEFCS